MERRALAGKVATFAAIGLLLTGCGQGTGNGAGEPSSRSPSPGSTTPSEPPGSRTPGTGTPGTGTPGTPDWTPSTPPPRRDPTRPTMPPRNPDDPTRQAKTILIKHARLDHLGRREVIITYELPSPCSPGLDHAQVDERPDRVVITLHREAPEPGDRPVCAQVIVERSTRLTLEEPLRGRTLVDGTTGKPIPG